MNLQSMRYESYENRGDGYQYYYHPESSENWIPMGDFKPCKDTDKNSDCFEVPYTTWGDYAGSTVERANYQWFLDTYKNNPFVFDIIGGYNSHSIVCHKDILQDEDIKELIEDLDNYPLFNDEELSKLEMTLESESWDSWVKYDLKRALDDAEIEYPEDDSKLAEIFYHVMRYCNIDGYCEDAVSWTIDIEKIVKHWNDGYCLSCGKMLDYPSQECDNCPKLI